MEIAGSPARGDLGDDIVTQLLLARGVAREDLARHRTPTLREFLPDPSSFRDMDAAAHRLAQAVLGNETVTIYGDYDVDGATSAALLIGLALAGVLGEMVGIVPVLTFSAAMWIVAGIVVLAVLPEEP